MSSPSSESSSALADSGRRELRRWQRRLLPFMTGSLVLLALVFFALSLYDVYEMRAFLGAETAQTSRAGVQALLKEARIGPASSAGVEVVNQSLLLLEADAMDKRYRQASALLMSRIWTRQLAFMTGMVLGFIGAVFILGKLSEAPSDVNLGDGNWKVAISSSSPGLILAFFGTVLIGTSLVVQPRIEVQDRPIYFMTMGIVRNAKAGAVPAETPANLDRGAIDPGLEEPVETKGK
jgi:hypothetical protein